MPDYDNNNSGALFKNDKEGNEKRPDYKGTCEVNNVEYWLSAWIKKSKNGNTFMSLSFQEKEERNYEKEMPPIPEPPDSEVPF